MEIHSFLGLAGYYRCFVKNFSRIIAPLTRLTKKNIRFEWDDSCESAFMELKQRLSSAFVCTIPTNQDSYVVYTDASDTDLGCVLMQNVRVLAYASR